MKAWRIALVVRKGDACKPGSWSISGYRIGVEIIDLGASFADISAQLDRIVADYFEAKKCT